MTTNQDTAPAKRGPGRPRKEGGVNPARSAGRHGQIWEDCEKQAKGDGQTMTEFVAAALARELAIRQRRKAAAQVAALRAGVDPVRMTGAGS
jgi:hypothetical protein